jgi:hypothetical protein
MSGTFKPTGPEVRGYALGYIYQAFGISMVEKEIASNIKDQEQKFQRLTGFSQSGLEGKWKTDPGYSTCGDFVGHYCTALGLRWISLLSTNNPKAYCESIGKGIAWIPRDTGLQPRIGDVFKQVFPPLVKNHTGISVACDGNTWWTAEGGQGKPPTYDSVKQTKKNNLNNGVQGWVDIELWAEVTEMPPVQVPKWLVGFWEVTWQGWKYYYFFGTDRQAAYTDRPALAPDLPFMNVGRGRFAVTLREVIVLWYDTGAVERFRIVPGVTDKMVGYLNGTADQLTAVKIIDISTIFPQF